MKTATPESIENYLRKVVKPEYFRETITSQLDSLEREAASILVARDGLVVMEVEEEHEEEKTKTLELYTNKLKYAAIEIERLRGELAKLPADYPPPIPIRPDPGV